MKSPPEKSGFSIVEIVIAVIIIGILAAILIPVLLKKAEKAKIAAAQRDLEEIANAEERVAVDTGHYVRLYALDDAPRHVAENLQLTSTRGYLGPMDPDDADYDNSPAIYMFISPRAYPSEDQRYGQDIVTNDDLLTALNYATTESPYKWEGPYLNLRRDEPRGPEEAKNQLPTRRHDTPTDPWGNDYLLFTRRGLIDESAGRGTLNPTPTFTLPDGSTIAVAANGLFDRPTLVSLGPDQEPGSPLPAGGREPLGSGDDLTRAFGY